ncbi:MAG: MFS transporter [Hellea sp.]|nr:MFS transporter [Hellea sp.]
MSLNTTQHAKTTSPERGYAWFVLFMLTLLYLMNYADRTVASALIEKIKLTYDVGDTYMGFVIGPAFAFVYCVAAIPIARFADRRNRIKIIALGAVVWSVFTVLSGMANTPGQFAAARFGVGVGEAAFLAPAYSVLSDYFPPKKRGLAFAVLNLGVYFGVLVGGIGGAQLAASYDWQWAFIILGAPGFIFALATFLLVKEPKRGRLDDNAGANLEEETVFKDVFALLWRQQSFRFLTYAAVLGGFAAVSFGTWAIPLFERIFEISNEEATTRYFLTTVGASILGVLAMGYLCDRGSKSDPRAPYRYSSLGFLGFSLIAIAICFMSDVNIATALVFPAALLGAGWVVAVQAALQDLVPAEHRATATAIWAFALTFAGLVIGVLFVGVFNDFLWETYGARAIRYSMALTLSVAIPAAWYIYRAGATAEADRIALSEA